MANGSDEKEAEFVVLRSDRRKTLRKQLLVLKIKGEDKKGVFFGYAKTVSRGGMFIASVTPRKVGEEFEITFRLPFLDYDLKCRCAVVWMREYEPHKQDPGMGIKFIDLDDEIKDKIEEWVGSKG
ncbi:MAG: PilZ domain-containing protein [Deltaproteobacteria bacterium]|nr:PilZ domain-containing protein [Deltaproteobacteria bacterium]